MVDPGRIEVPLHGVDPDEMLSAAKKSTYGWEPTLSYPLKLSSSENAQIPLPTLRRHSAGRLHVFSTKTRQPYILMKVHEANSFSKLA